MYLYFGSLREADRQARTCSPLPVYSATQDLGMHLKSCSKTAFVGERSRIGCISAIQWTKKQLYPIGWWL
ncbi:hypothetical protein AcW1_004432 [Taiwanofungus camphoratus]|nr:hypothetical protein AcV7_008148 [Antrodia cinnamomea]KAI0959669.1 hypothetical protein AcW1_004432 [Antrodia cinnamomea]